MKNLYARLLAYLYKKIVLEEEYIKPKDCSMGHDFGRVKQWEGKQGRKCRRCGVVDYG